MDKEKFASIMTEEGYSQQAVDVLWETTGKGMEEEAKSMQEEGISLEAIDEIQETALRATCRLLLSYAPEDFRALT